MTARLFIPQWRPPLVNEWRGKHWSVAHKLRRATTDLLALYALTQGVPKATGRRRVSVEILLAPRMRRPDRDAFDKLFLDAMVAAGLLLDDGDRGLAGRVEVTFRRVPAAEWGTIITVEDLDGS